MHLQEPDDSLKALCNMYELYRDSTLFLSAIQPDDPLHAHYSSAQFVTWKAMQTACLWVGILHGKSRLCVAMCL